MTDDYKKTWTMRIVDFDRHLRPTDAHPGKFELQSFHMGLYSDQPNSGQPRNVHMSDVSVMRESDAATPILMRLCHSGEVLPKVVIEMITEKDGVEVSRMTFELVNASIANISPGGSPHGTGPGIGMQETLSLRYEKLKSSVIEGERKGGAELVPPAPPP